MSGELYPRVDESFERGGAEYSAFHDEALLALGSLRSGRQEGRSDHEGR